MADTTVWGAICPKCSDFVFSRARHDQRFCSCGNTWVDGGIKFEHLGTKEGKALVQKREVDASPKEIYEDWERDYNLLGRIGNKPEREREDAMADSAEQKKPEEKKEPKYTNLRADITVDMRKAIVRRYLNGERGETLVREFKIGGGTLTRWAHDPRYNGNAAAAGKSPVSSKDVRRKAMHDYHDRNMTAQEVATRYKVSVGTVYSWAQRWRKTRAVSETKKSHETRAPSKLPYGQNAVLAGLEKELKKSLDRAEALRIAIKALKR